MVSCISNVEYRRVGGSMATIIQRRMFTIHDYARMRESGILTEDDRVELINGEVRLMSPIGPVHIALVNKLNQILTIHIGTDAIVSIQNPIQLDDFTEPQPDIAILQAREDFYVSGTPRADDVLLVIEISDSTIDYDRNEKTPRYASAHIPEVWIIDVNRKVIEQYSKPFKGEYTQILKLLLGSTIQSQSLPAVSIDVDKIFS
jgi:Uma2 family endonuclease